MHRTLGHHQGGDKITLLPSASLDNLRVAGFALDTVIETQVIAVTVHIVFLVGLIMPIVVGDQVVQGVAIMVGDVVNGR